jgi:hypothetical protein
MLDGTGGARFISRHDDQHRAGHQQQCGPDNQ